MIIVEGPDGGGKTTTIRFIRAAFPQYQVIHSPGPMKNEEQFKERLYWNNELCKVPNLIMDRCMIFSEYIYGNVLRGESRVSYEELIDFVLGIQRARGLLIVYCSMHNEQVDDSESLLSPGEHQVLEDEVVKNIELIRSAYRKLFSQLQASHNTLIIHRVEAPLDIIPLLEIIGEINNECE